MEKYYFTEKGYEEFLSNFNNIKKELDEATANKAACGAGSDTWHDEGFKIGIGEEMMWSKSFGKLQEIKRNSLVVAPVEQNEKVLLGNGVILDDGSKEIFLFVDGYLSKITKNRVSLYSPIGAVLLSKTVGQSVSIEVAGDTKRFVLKKILLPSEALKKIIK
jgi:transcription elongation GreA/GreB family factor